MRNLEAKIVDQYIYQDEKIEAQGKKRVYTDWLFSENHKTADGKFKYRKDECSEPFKHDGRKCIDHEKGHGLHQIEKEINRSTSGDEMVNYRCSFLEYGLFLLNFYDAISEEVGSRLIKCWKIFPPIPS